MSTAKTPLEKIEDFPLNILLRMELKIQKFRRILMQKAADASRLSSPPGEKTFTVTEEHIKEAVSKLIRPEFLVFFD